VTNFLIWLERRLERVSSSVLQNYEQAFKQALTQLIGRTHDPVLKQRFREMLDCPIKNTRGQCRSFSDYILDALIKNGIQRRYDIEAALGYVVEKMLLTKNDAGEPRITVFSDFDETRPYSPGDNPLQARFMKFLQFAVNNIRKGKIPRLGFSTKAVSIGQGRSHDEPNQGVSPEHLPAKATDDRDFDDLVNDLAHVLAQKEAAYGVPLVQIFREMLAGKRSDALRAAYGDRRAKLARQVIIQTIEEYGKKTENYFLLRFVQALKAGERSSTAPPKTAVKPKVQPGKQTDFASIASVIDKFGGEHVGSSQLGQARRRWLELPPRDPSSGYRNRLEEVLAAMVADGVLKATRTAKGAVVYGVGPKIDQYRSGVTVS
jgi:hypothetical protein